MIWPRVRPGHRQLNDFLTGVGSGYVPHPVMKVSVLVCPGESHVPLITRKVSGSVVGLDTIWLEETGRTAGKWSVGRRENTALSSQPSGSFIPHTAEYLSSALHLMSAPYPIYHLTNPNAI